MMRTLLLGFLACWLPSHATEPMPMITLYTPAACQPCADWAQHWRNSGFAVTEEEKEPHALRKVKRWLNVPSQYEAVHTARVAGYFLEGPVPANEVRHLLSSKPVARGLVTTLPAGEPAAGRTFDTLLVGPDGAISRFAHH